MAISLTSLELQLLESANIMRSPFGCRVKDPHFFAAVFKRIGDVSNEEYQEI